MVLSCLVEPLVSPLIGRGTSGPGRRTALTRRRLASTALAMSALVAVATHADLEDIRRTGTQEETTVRNAHKKPDAVPYRAVLDAFLGREEEALARAPAESPAFEWDAIIAHRLKHARSGAADSGPGLGLARRVDRVTASRERAYLLFGSGQPRSGAPHHTI